MHPVKKLVDSDYAFFISLYTVSVPYGILFFFSKVAVGFERADAIFRSDMDKVLCKPAHFVATPAGNRTVVNASGLVRNHQILAYSYYFAKAAACRARPKWRIETEEIFIRFAESNAIQFETVAEPCSFQLRAFSFSESKAHRSPSAGESVRNG